MTPTSTYTCPDGSVTASRDDWTASIIVWLEAQLAWHTALTPAGRKAIKLAVRKYLDPEGGIFVAQGRWAKEAKITRSNTLNPQLRIAVRVGLLVSNDMPINRPPGSSRGGRSTNVYFPAVGLDVCPGIACFDAQPDSEPDTETRQ